MKDERKACANCQHEHAWGVLRYSMDNVPLYGARKCWCGCDRFVAVVEGNENLPAMTQDQTAALWAKTSFLSAQVPAATRMAMAGIMNLLEVASTDIPSPAIVSAVREFMGLMISQVTDIRGALVRDDSKFASLVSHTDEVVESMKGVVQLNDRLMTLGNHVNETAERMERLEGLVQRIADAVLPPEPTVVDDVANLESQIDRQHKLDDLTPWDGLPAKDIEARRVFLEKTAALRDEAIITDADTLDD